MRYRCQSDGIVEEIEADSSREAAEEYVAGGDWADEGRTFFVQVYVSQVDDEDGDYTSHKVQVDPAEPPCDDGDEHDWKDGPVRGSGGGVAYTDTCRRCGLRRHTDTWASDPSDGTQGHRTIRYSDPDPE